MSFAVLLTDGTNEVVADADGYSPEGPLTTFFSVDPGRHPRLDTWSVKLMSIRTDRILHIRRIDTAVSRPHLSLAE